MRIIKITDESCDLFNGDKSCYVKCGRTDKCVYNCDMHYNKNWAQLYDKIENTKNKIKICIFAAYKLFIKHKLSNYTKRVAKIDVTYFTNISSSDFSEHMSFLYTYLCITKPQSILELGTRGGESTKVFEKYCSQANVIGRSIDLHPAPEWLIKSKFWRHYTGDDISLGQQIVANKKWPDGETITDLDFIFVDTSHLYTHTLQELHTFTPLLNSEVGAIAFHDSNLSFKPQRRLDGKINLGWNNQRGIARAIEEFFNLNFNEDDLQIKHSNDQKWVLYHQPWCNGFSLLSPYHSLRT